jgi:hypothetical protein
MDDKIFQEFYCGECEHYMRVRLNMSYNRTIMVQCPNCEHKHQRYIEDGVILERGRHEHGNAKEDIVIPKSACSKDPISKKMQKAKSHEKRDAVVIESSRDLGSDSFIKQLWQDYFGEG